MNRAGAALLAVAAVAAVAPRAARADGHTIAVAPLATLGAEATSAEAKQLQAELEKALAKVEGYRVVDSGAVLDKIKKARRPELRVCEGDNKCLAELGKLVGADLVVAGEAGGLGDVQVVYLELVDAGSAREVRSTTLEVAANGEGGARGAADRLLAPERYTGTLTLAVDADGATIYVDGKKVGKSPQGPVSLSVGTHALRVTHPEYRDFVRFVDVDFGRDNKIDVALHEYPVVSRELSGDGKHGAHGNVTYIDTPAPWYRKWWAIAAFTGVVAVSAGVTFGIIADGVDADTVRPVTPP